MQTGIIRLISYAGNGEDVVLTRAFHGRAEDVFVDVGAAHPLWGSVTRNLIEQLGWAGVHIEPHPVQAQRLRDAYPSHVVEQIAVGEQAGTADYFLVSGNVDETDTDPNAGLSTMDRDNAAELAVEGFHVERRTVPVRRLDDVLEEAGVPVGFGLLKIDVEGYEREVLRGVTLSHWKPKCLLVEATHPNSMRVDEGWREAIDLDEYRSVLFDGVNEFFVHHDHPELAWLISIPVNSIDASLSVFWYNRLSADERPTVRLTPWPV